MCEFLLADFTSIKWGVHGHSRKSPNDNEGSSKECFRTHIVSQKLTFNYHISNQQSKSLKENQTTHFYVNNCTRIRSIRIRCWQLAQRNLRAAWSVLLLSFVCWKSSSFIVKLWCEREVGSRLGPSQDKWSSCLHALPFVSKTQILAFTQYPSLTNTVHVHCTNTCSIPQGL
jgi:hypothetical protein